MKKLLKERLQQLAGIKPLYKLTEQNVSNPFSGGSGPNWTDAESAWASWNSANQGNAPRPNAVFLGNMAGKGCNFYQARLTAQVNSFVNQFGGSFGGAGSSNPAWQSEKYARIMWLANEVQNCSGTTNVTCFSDFINDAANDGPLTSAVCANGNAALSPQNIQNTKFRHQSISDCTMLDNKIAEIAAQIPTTSGCQTIRKQAKHDYLTNLQNNCCASPI